jgi:hypothetical protein
VSDAAPPGEPPDGTPFPEPPPDKHGFAAWPLWTRVLVASAGVLVLVAVDERAELGGDLGLTAQATPFPTDETVTVDAFPDRYSRFVRDTTAADDTAIIAVFDARPQ